MNENVQKKLKFMVELAEWLETQKYLEDGEDQRKAMEQVIREIVEEGQRVIKNVD